MSEWRAPRATEIDRKMREDFHRRLREYGITPEGTDPLLAVLFRSFAVQVEDIYKQAGDSIPAALLDELITGLGMPERRARPAQTVLQFSLPEGREMFEAGTELIGETESGERLVFALDSAIEVSSASIVFAAGYQDGFLRLLSGLELPKAFEDARPSLDPAPASLGPNPAIFLAIDSDDDNYLDHHGFYFELVPEAKDLSASLQREVWCLLDDAGTVQGDGMLRSRMGNYGIRHLEWLSRLGYETPDSRVEGFYGGRVFMLPVIPSERRFRARIPRNMEGPISRLFGKATGALFSKPRVWIRIALSRGSSNLNDDVVRIALHCVTASNVEVFNQTFHFSATGTSVPVSREGGARKCLVAPLSIKGELGSEYVPESHPTADSNAGRYRFRKGRLELTPARTSRGLSDKYANIRLLVSDGSRANTVRASAVSTLVSKVTTPLLGVTNLTAAAGGTDGEPYPDARKRFAELLLCRDRVITPMDLEATVKAFNPKISVVRIQPALERTSDGLRRIQQVTVVIDKGLLVNPDEESRILQRDLEALLQGRFLLDIEVRVVVEWL